ncbi:Panacea domain-containing protein [Bacillus altitudinis]|uniref:Panacea domain-containing protein n=1 Tax=Bacillus altitudinis TaxID=293387 RepID=UPI0025AB4126|nr:type II toxin-antitoxin system antitoxin SocA domain-containing protein [Bacillus altitudinis]MDN0040566.1 DUF4065 domain-containing protein [Bacillus aerophilus]WLF28881.1 DUF4065 domain-containing protein [Bacillus altitudinis]
MKISLAAKYLLSKSKLNTKYEITPKKLQKILYYAQSWFLVKEKKPLFENEHFQAWQHGPVNYPIYMEYKNYGYFPIPPVNFSEELLSHNERSHLDSIWGTYGHYSADELEHLTHKEDPWIITRGDLGPDAPSSEVISEEIISQYYTRVSDDLAEGTWKSPLVPELKLEYLIFPKQKTAENPLLKYAGKWSGNDLDECIEEVYNNRVEVKFD